jgi:RNA polymerase sigma-70 factor (ECF subfamily)
MSGFEDSLAQAMDFDAIVEVYQPRIFRFAFASLRDRDAAETIAQDCLLKAFHAQSSFRGDCSMQTWLMGIAVNLIRDYSRNRRLQFWRRTSRAPMPPERVSLVSSPSANGSPETLALLKQQVECVWATAELLSDRQRAVFLLRFVEDMDILEIAAATGMKEGTVKQHLFRALQAVRLKMGQAGMGQEPWARIRTINWFLAACSVEISPSFQIVPKTAWLLNRQAGWTFAVIVLLAVFGVTLTLHQQPAPNMQSLASDGDAALLDHVRTDVARRVPSGMEPLFMLGSTFDEHGEHAGETLPWLLAAFFS